jgi:pimeloyl-ACP methyl ester carboxylesterase
VPGATHDVSLEKPDVVNKTIEEFLETLNKVKFQQDNN